MKYKDFEDAFSAARLNKYKNACGGNTNKALTLYRHNVKLCQKFYGVLNIFEIVLRNAINRHYTTHFNDADWIYHQLQSGGMLEHSPHQRDTLNDITTMVAKGKYTPDKVVASVSFGFWTYMFTKVPFRLGGQSLLQIFSARQSGLGQKAIFKELQQIKAFRNRIAHHEPICFDAAGRKSMVYAQTNYALILKYITFLGYDKDHLLIGLDIMPDAVMNKIIQL
jgi:hypothetical protein